MERDEVSLHHYAAFVSSQCKMHDYLRFGRDGVSKVGEYGSRLAEHQGRLSTHFIEIADLVSDSCYWAQQDQAERVGASHVAKAIQEHEYRSSLIDERMRDLVVEGTIVFEGKGSRIG